MDRGETAGDAAARELLEETGWPALKVTELGLLHSNTSLIASAVAVCRWTLTATRWKAPMARSTRCCSSAWPNSRR
ncbi:NUDIX hydrolase [Pseudomonas sp. PCH446]